MLHCSACAVVSSWRRFIVCSTTHADTVVVSWGSCVLRRCEDLRSADWVLEIEFSDLKDVFNSVRGGILGVEGDTPYLIRQ